MNHLLPIYYLPIYLQSTYQSISLYPYIIKKEELTSQLDRDIKNTRSVGESILVVLTLIRPTTTNGSRLSKLTEITFSWAMVSIHLHFGSNN